MSLCRRRCCQQSRVLIFMFFFLFDSRRNYLRRRDNEISVSTELLNTIRKIINSEREPDVNIYQEVQRGVEEKIALTTYPKFFQSRLYFDYSEQVQKRWEALNNNYSTGSSHVSSGSNYKQYGGEVSSGCVTLSPCDSLGASCSNLQESLTMNSVLPTLHEDTELTIHDDVSTKSLGGRSTKPKLTKESLLRTQSRRLVDVLAKYVIAFESIFFFNFHFAPHYLIYFFVAIRLF